MEINIPITFSREEVERNEEEFEVGKVGKMRKLKEKVIKVS